MKIRCTDSSRRTSELLCGFQTCEQYSSNGIIYVLKPSIKIDGFLETKIFFSKNNLCLALAMMEEICSLKSNFELKLTPRSITSFVSGKFALANSNAYPSGFWFLDLCLLEIDSHFDFSVEIGNCQVSAHFVIFVRISLKALPSSSFTWELYAFKSSAYSLGIKGGEISSVMSFM